MPHMLWHTPTPFTFGSNVSLYSTKWIHAFQRHPPLVQTVDYPFSSSSQKSRSLSSPKGFLDEWEWLPRQDWALTTKYQSSSFQLIFSLVSQGNETAVGCLSVSICSLFLSQHFPTPKAFGVSSQLQHFAKQRSSQRHKVPTAPLHSKQPLHQGHW